MTIQNKSIESIYPLLPMQQGMLFHTLYTPNSGVYFEQLVCTLDGKLNASAFHQAWLQVVERHQAFRSSFVWEHGKQPLQVVHKYVELPWQNLDWQELSITEQQQQIELVLESEREEGFKLNQAPLMRCTLITVADNNYQFIWSHHHLLIDGWCLSIILKEVLAFYEASVQAETLYLAPPYPYKDYIAWLQKQDISQSQAFWQKILQGFTEPTPLTANKLKSNHSDRGQTYLEHHLSLSKKLTKNLQALGQEQHLTLNTLVQAAWALLLSRYTGESDILFGTTFSGRPATLLGAESMVGLFINTLPVRVKVAPETQLLSWLKQLQSQQIELEQYSYTSLTDIQEWSDVPRGKSLFESLVVFENYPLDISLLESNSSLKITDVHSFERTNYPLTIVVTPKAELSVQVKYDAHCFDVGIIKQILGNFQTLLENMVIKPHASLSELQLLTNTEQHQLLVEWNDTQTEYPQDKCIHQLFEEQVAKTPDSVAVVFEQQELTYQQLNQRANQLAHHLQTLGVKPEVLVGICVERSLEMVVGLLGILKAGGAYVPLDPSYPTERLSYLVSDAGIEVLLTQNNLLSVLPSHAARVVCLDTDGGVIESHRQDNLVTDVRAENLAYVIYTSGSTGQPKGVCVTHRSVVRLVQNTNYAHFNAEQVFFQLAPITFDASTLELWGSLLHGSKLVIFPSQVPDLDLLIDVLYQHQITFLWLTAGLFHLMVDEYLEALSPVQQLLAGGDVLSVDHVQRFRERYPNCHLINGYGPTENTTFTCCYSIGQTQDLQQTVPIGRPIANTQVYILDSQLQPVPIGVAGELHIGGDGLARGYLNRPELTQAKFIPNPFSSDKSARLYKTGDLARYLPDGNIEFLGRIDNQVKMRGFRIELGEVEAALAQYSNIQQVTVIAREDIPGDKRLVAYLINNNEQTPSIKDLRQFLKDKLPEYMMPAAFVCLERFPLTANGKIDRRALPAPDASCYVQALCYQAPSTPKEEIVAAVWSEVLGVEVGVNTNFLEAGGHSLLATQVISRLQKAFAVELPLHYLFQYPTIAELSECIDRVSQDGKILNLPPIKSVTRTGNLPLSFAQQRLWFLDQLEEGSSTYNVPSALELKGTLNPAALEQSLVAICQRHEAFRTNFPAVNGHPVQAIASDMNITMSTVNLQSIPEQEQTHKVQELILEAAETPFDLANGNLLRATLLRLNPEFHVLILVMHHIICDGWSMGIFLSEISTLYSDSIKGSPPSLPPLPIQYADFACWQHQYLTGEVMETNLSYWKQQLANLPTLELSTDRPPIQTFRGAMQNFVLSPDLSAEIKALSRREEATLFMTLLAAFKILLSFHTNQDDIVVGTDIANRKQIETEGIIGFFVNQLVLRTDLSKSPSCREILRRVRHNTLAAYDHQDMPFDQLVTALNPERDLSRTPLFQSKFVLQNAPMPPLQLDDLTLNIVEIDDGTAKFDLLLTLWETEQGLSGNLEYSTDLFNADTIAQILSKYQIILHTFVTQSNINLQSLKTILVAADKENQAIKEKEFQQVRRDKFKNLQLQSSKKV